MRNSQEIPEKVMRKMRISQESDKKIILKKITKKS